MKSGTGAHQAASSISKVNLLPITIRQRSVLSKDRALQLTKTVIASGAGASYCDNQLRTIRRFRSRVAAFLQRTGLPPLSQVPSSVDERSP